MKMFTEKQITIAARMWYNNTDLDNLCLAENRLMRGERPEGWKE